MVEEGGLSAGGWRLEADGVYGNGVDPLLETL